MLFNSLIFTVFLPLVFVVYWIIRPAYRNYFLLLASYYFYFSYSPWYLLLLIGTSAFDYWCAKKIAGSSHKKTFLYLSILSNIGVLAIFKYSAFFYNNGVSIVNHFSENDLTLMESFVIPAGLSFYTFQSLSYTIDVYRGKYAPKDKLYEFLLYVSFFPHMVAGPIVRYNDLMPQLKAIHYFKQINWQAFATLTIWGYFKKLVIADNLNSIVTPVFNAVDSYNASELLAAGALFVIQVYCDFSGYSDIATGVAKLFNINLSLNWRRPLFSRSLHEFWQRNHISITTWFRDYLYIGLGGSRVSYQRWLVNIFLVFVISGFWHGANVTFIIWGSIHGLFFIAEILLRKYFPNLSLPSFLSWIYLLSVHTLALIAFRANSYEDLCVIYSQLFQFDFGSMNSLLILQDSFYFGVMALLLTFGFLKELNEEWAFVNRFKGTYAVLKPMMYILMVVLIFCFGNFSANTFIYFQF